MVDEVLCVRNGSAERADMLLLLGPTTPSASTVAMVHERPQLFPTVDVPDHAHYTVGAVILIIGITGIVGNFLVIYAFTRSRTLRTPANMFIINLAITDFFMCATQTPTFFITSMHKRWIFGKKEACHLRRPGISTEKIKENVPESPSAPHHQSDTKQLQELQTLDELVEHPPQKKTDVAGCELYAFCGALFGICSMITLMVIAVDRYFVITRPLHSIGILSQKRALLVLMCAWIYTLGWSLPPFFGWSAYVPEGLMTSCTWDYVTFTPSVRAYTMLLFIFVFFIPLIIIIYCYIFIFRAVRNSNQDVVKLNRYNSRDSVKRINKMKKEWKMAKVALIVILLYVISWSPYSIMALTAFSGYADILTPYMNSVPAVIAKASAIHNPIIYAITHPKYRVAIAKYIPCLRVLLCVPQRELHSLHSSVISTRLSTITTRASDLSGKFSHNSTGKSNISSASDGESEGNESMDGAAIQMPRIVVTSESELFLTSVK